ncbi:xanthine dehydrogenase small subunit [Roseivivax sp. CAU 1761]
MEIGFLLNGESVTVRDAPPTLTLLDWLREARGLTGTKEGCNEGDCGACTVMVTDPEGGVRALNACILFLPQLAGRAVRTVEGIAGPDGALHPVQQALIDHHGSQCGFCTPGFVVSMAVAHLNGEADTEAALAGNLCRCTGYVPIRRAAAAAAGAPVPDWLRDAAPARPAAAPADEAETPPRDRDPRPASAIRPAHAPETLAALFELTARHPEATLVAGATDVGLWVTKDLHDLDRVIFLNRCADLQRIETGEGRIRFGAGVTLDRVQRELATRHPSFAAMLRRFGSAQVRAAATIGGNIANGSPIGDTPPPLIALDAVLHLEGPEGPRDLPLEDFFVAYGEQDRRAGEVVTGVTLPEAAPRLKVYKLSKRFDQDISAVCGAFDIRVEDGIVTAARIAFGGMAATPRRARAVEAELLGRDWGEEAVGAAWDAWEEDFQPISDMRASAAYRLAGARNMLSRYLLEDLGARTSVLEVAP